MKRLVKVISVKSGDVIWQNLYTDNNELATDLKVILKPSTFGGVEFKIEIQRI